MMKKIAVFCSFSSLKNDNGYGFAFNFYKYLASFYNVIVVCPRSNPFIRDERFRANNKWEINIVSASEDFSYNNQIAPSMIEHEFAAIAEQDGWFVKKIEHIVNQADVIICDSFVWGRFVKKVFPKKYMIIRCLDIEHDKIECLCKRDDFSVAQIQDLRKMQLKMSFLERESLNSADKLLVLTPSDKDRINELYGIKQNVIDVMPICCLHKEAYLNYFPKKRSENNKINVVFVGYIADDPWGVLEDLQRISDVDERINVHVIGYIDKKKSLDIIAKNVILHGELSESEKLKIISQCDAALNLSNQSYGMNVKIIEYISLGIPVISTIIGVRGYAMEAYKHYVPITMDNPSEGIDFFTKMEESARYKISINAYESFLKNNFYDIYWEKLCPTLLKEDGSKNNIEYIVFGGGDLGRELFRYIEDSHNVILAYTDNNSDKWGKKKKILGKEVISPKMAFKFVNVSDARIVLAVKMPKNIKDIFTQCIEGGVNPQKIDVYFDGKISPRYIDYDLLMGKLH